MSTVDPFDALTADELLDLARREHANTPGATDQARNAEGGNAMPDDDRELIAVPYSQIKSKSPPVCDACGRHMRWHGSTQGWGCPVGGGDPECRSSLYRPKRNPQQKWLYGDRYPERKEGT